MPLGDHELSYKEVVGNQHALTKLFKQYPDLTDLSYAAIYGHDEPAVQALGQLPIPVQTLIMKLGTPLTGGAFDVANPRYD